MPHPCTRSHSSDHSEPLARRYSSAFYQAVDDESRIIAIDFMAPYPEFISCHPDYSGSKAYPECDPNYQFMFEFLKEFVVQYVNSLHPDRIAAIGHSWNFDQTLRDTTFTERNAFLQTADQNAWATYTYMATKDDLFHACTPGHARDRPS